MLCSGGWPDALASTSWMLGPQACATIFSVCAARDQIQGFVHAWKAYSQISYIPNSTPVILTMRVYHSSISPWRVCIYKESGNLGSTINHNLMVPKHPGFWSLSCAPFHWTSAKLIRSWRSWSFSGFDVSSPPKVYKLTGRYTNILATKYQF